MSVTLRFFAAARAAVGVDEVALPLVSGSAAALGDLVASVRPAASVDPAEAETVLGRCSFLVDGVSTRDRSTSVPDGSTVDVMPPFAGG